MPSSTRLNRFKTKRTRQAREGQLPAERAGHGTYSLKGPSRRTVKLGRIAAGTHGFTLRRLKRGNYRGVLTVVDDFDKKITPRNSFVVR